MLCSLSPQTFVQKTLDDTEQLIVVESTASVCSTVHDFKTDGQTELLVFAMQFV
jgi:hypothetical protein